MGLVRVPSGEDGIGHSSFRSAWDWTKLISEQMGLIRTPSGVGLVRSLSEFLIEQLYDKIMELNSDI